MDPRIHYRPMVSALQESNAELHQLINVIDMIRGKEFLEEKYCSREDTVPKTKDLNILLEAKACQMKEAADILTSGVASLETAIHREHRYLQSIVSLLGKWKVSAPNHGNIPKPIRADEILAIDCSYQSAGSIFEPSKVTLSAMASARIERTTDGLAKVTYPDAYISHTLLFEIINSETDAMGSYIIPNQPMGDENEQVLRCVQHSVFCEELFHTIMQEALRGETYWINTMRWNSEHAIVLDVFDDQVRVRLDESYILRICLADLNIAASSIPTDPALDRLARSTSLLFESELLEYYQRVKTPRFQLFQDDSLKRHKSSHPMAESNILSPVLRYISHALLRLQVGEILDTTSARVCPKKFGVDSMCDSVVGISFKTKWKQLTRERSTVELSIGKHFTTEIVIQEHEIQFNKGTLAEWGPNLPARTSCFTIGTFQDELNEMLRMQLIESLYRAVRAVGMKRIQIDLDHLTIRIFSATEWDGSTYGDRKVSGPIPVGCIVIKCTQDLQLTCQTQALGLIPELESLSGDDSFLKWTDIPGLFDRAKIEWLLQRIGVEPIP